MDIGIVFKDSVAEALNSIGSNEHYIALTDLDANGGDGSGIDTLRNIVDSAMFDWIIAVGDAAARDTIVGEIGLERCAFLLKPVDTDELRQLIDSISEVHALRREVTVKTRKLSHLEVINEIARETLRTRDENTLLWKIARLVNEKLGYYNVNIFLINEADDNVVLKAFAGGFGEDLKAGYSLKLGEGITGWVAQNREPLILGDVESDPRRIIGFEFEERVQSELGVPIIVDNRVLGVIHVESVERNAFTRDDIIMLETVADQMAMAFENLRLSDELLDAFEISSTINDSLPVFIVLVDTDLNVMYVNQTFCEVMKLSKNDILNRPITNYLAQELVENLNLTKELRKIFESGIPVCHTNVHHTSPYHADKILNITMARVQAGRRPRAMVLIQDVTDFTIKTRQLSLIREISIAMQGVFERDKLLHMILTSVTAGFGMGFNRAFLFLTDTGKKKLIGTMGVGPTSREEAYRIWSELSRQAFTFDDYMKIIGSGDISRSNLQDLVTGLDFDLEKQENILVDTVKNCSYYHVLDAWENPRVDDDMKRIIAAGEFVTIPLVAKSEVIGVVFADNAYSGTPIVDEAIEELSMFAASAALAIENSRMLEVLENQVKELEEAYKKLENTHAMLIRHEKLAAVGEVSTRLAHEIRNPLATIGGFAQSIPRKYEDRERTIRNANIIVEEVRRLENILTNVLDFTKAGVPQKSPNDVNEMVKQTLKMMEGAANERGILLVLELTPGDLVAEFDAPQIKQVLINLTQNAFNAMSEGGVLAIFTGRSDGFVTVTVRDTGCGIPEEYLDNIFDPFFTTRQDGTGLGLSISQRIVMNHGGRLDITSKEGAGTTITILLPVTS